MKSWSQLPVEIQKLVFTLAHNPSRKGDIRQCELVCKNWKATAQSVLYSHANLYSKEDFDKFMNTVINNKQYGLEKSVESINLWIILVTLREYKSTIEHLATHLPFVKRIATSVSSHGLYLTLIHANLDSRFKYLEHIEAPDANKDFEMYMVCALMYRNQLVSLTLSDELEDEHIDRELSLAQYNRLFDRLDTFSQLTNLKLERTTENGVDTLETVVEKCKKLKTLNVELFSTGDAINNSTNIDLSLYAPRPDIKTFSGHLETGVKNNKLLLYIMRKFPQLQDCQLDGETHDETIIDPSVASQFIYFLSKIPTHSFDNMPVKLDFIADTLGNYWKSLSGEQLHDVRIRYNKFRQTAEQNEAFIDVRGSKGGSSCMSIEYPVSREVLMSHLQALRKIESWVGQLTIDFNHCELEPEYTNNMMSGYCLDQIFNIFHHLRHLILSSGTPSQFMPSTSENSSIEELTIRQGKLCTGGLEDLSRRLPSMRKVLLTANNIDSSIVIYMKNTNLESLTMRVFPENKLQNLFYVKVSTTRSNDKYYKHVQNWGPDYFSSKTEEKHSLTDSNEEEYKNSLGDSDCISLFICCKSIAILSIELGYKKAIFKEWA